MKGFGTTVPVVLISAFQTGIVTKIEQSEKKQ
jgi:hypothetical protein